MKTKQEKEADLYRNTKLDHNIAIASYIVFGIGLLVDIITRLEGNENHFEIASKAIGLVFPLVFCCVTLYHFFFPINIGKKKEKIMKALDSLKKEKENFEKLAINESQNQIPEKVYQKKFEETQEKIWKIEWELKQIGG